jgi:hypothetical protein
MELVAIFIIPILASGLSMLPTSRRLAAPILLQWQWTHRVAGT